MKISFDFDFTLTNKKLQYICKILAKHDPNSVFIITSRLSSNNNNDLWLVAKELGIKEENVYFTEGKYKLCTLCKVGIDLHIDDDRHEIMEIQDKHPTCMALWISERETEIVYTN